MRVAFAGAAETLEETGYVDACPIATVALEVASTNEPLRRVTAEIFEGWLAGLDVLFLGAGGRGRRRPATSSTLFLAALEGGFLLCRAAKDTAPMAALGRTVASPPSRPPSPRRGPACPAGCWARTVDRPWPRAAGTTGAGG